jgi:hypothetical protein
MPRKHVKSVVISLALAGLAGGALAQKAAPAPSAKPTPSAEAMALARRVAAHDDFVAMISFAGQAQVAGIEQSLGALTPAEKAKADAIGKATLAEGVNRVTDRLSVSYADAYSVADLKVIAAFLETPAGQAYSGRLMKVLPGLGESMKGFDFKREFLAQACTQISKGCAPKPEPKMEMPAPKP